uniref:C2H2-type domain-containing protein n=1 Tax=Caenorhabditis tropicalis TaxID=1561998 RepID=A0A1I7UUY8_9PELO
MSFPSPIQVRCPLCPTDIPIQNPEELCGHMAEIHSIPTTMQSKSFESFAHFQIWLSNIEDSRCDGGYLGSSQGPTYEDEYYLLCRRRPSATSKRRRMSDDSAGGHELNSIVACTAFVHVFETMDGRVTVRYCLDHCGHPTEETTRDEQRKVRTRSNLKRSSPCATFEYCDESCDCEHSSSSMASSPTSSVDFEDEDQSNNNYKLQDSYTVSNLNAIINQRLDSTADRLRTLTKVLQELAVDIRNTDLNKHQQMVI